MQSNLVIVESPAKAKTIEKFLGKDFKVMSSYGHIRDLKSKEISINEDSMSPEYEIPKEKAKLVQDLKVAAKAADTIWLASDEDREGEAISWHLCEVLGLDKETTNRIVFHEITKNAILEAIQNPRHLNMDLVNAQQARRVLDRIVGFKLSPILWKKIKPSLSAGRVQSVAVRLLVEKEREIQNFKSAAYYRVMGLFALGDAEIKAELANRLTAEQALAFLEKCKDATFTIGNIQQKPVKHYPAPPFTTSTLQQEASRKLGMTVKQTMMVAQHLYESGKITYMRTDSVNLSTLCLGASKQVITELYGSDYSHPRQFQTSSKGAQEAHEAIRPTYMTDAEIEGSNQEKKLYELIWKRTIASQMTEAELEKTTVNIKVSNCNEEFIANGEIIKFDGFLKVYRESSDEEEGEDCQSIFPAMSVGDNLLRTEIVAKERYTQPPSRYTEASLVHKLEELGIGRPSTYAPTITTIQQREYVVRSDKKGEEKQISVLKLKGNNIKRSTKKEIIGSDKKKLTPTDIGTIVNDFLMQCFPDIMDYNFTATVEAEFDKIAEGGAKWQKMIKDFYTDFEPELKKTLNIKSEHKVGERQVGIDPKSGKPVFVKIGRFGPLAQIGSAEDKEKPRFAQLPKEYGIETVTLDEVLELFKLPRELGEFEGSQIIVGTGRFGAYLLHNKKYVTLPKHEDPLTIAYDTAVAMIKENRVAEAQKQIKVFDEEPNLKVMNGRYGSYLAYNGKNYKLTKALQSRAAELTLEECMKVINDR